MYFNITEFNADFYKENYRVSLALCFNLDRILLMFYLCRILCMIARSDIYADKQNGKLSM